MSAEPWSASAFEARYRANPDPWDFAGSPYEQGRYDTLLRGLSRDGYRRGYEPGCSVGALTIRLAARCERLFAIDVSATAIATARDRCRAAGNVELTVGSVAEPPPRDLDLLVFSEIGYYFSVPELDRVIARLHDAVVPGGELAACHWLGTSPDHQLHGSVVHERLRAGTRDRLRDELSRRNLRLRRRDLAAHVRRASRWSVGVVVPARNEARLIESCVASVLDAFGATAAEIDLWVVVVADSCTDDTASRAMRRLAHRGEVIVVDARTVGGARRGGYAVRARTFQSHRGVRRPDLADGNRRRQRRAGELDHGSPARRRRGRRRGSRNGERGIVLRASIAASWSSTAATTRFVPTADTVIAMARTSAYAPTPISRPEGGSPWPAARTTRCGNDSVRSQCRSCRRSRVRS